jgi:hypothetical protein
MNRNDAEIYLWAAFPGADAVVAQYIDKQMGLGVEFQGVKRGIRFNPAKDNIHAVIGQLRAQFEPN